MDFYQNAVEMEDAANVLYDAGKYRQAIYLYCLAVELYLKSRLPLVMHDDDLEVSHNIVGLYNALKARFKPTKNLNEYMARSRKYFNESRYPYVGDTSIYKREFADEFIDIVEAVKSYVDNECVATEEDLLKKFTKEN